MLLPSTGVLEGPSSRTTLVGPEGSVISSVAPGGKVITETLPGGAAYSAPSLVAPVLAPGVFSAYSASVLPAHVAPLTHLVSGYSAPVVPAPLVAGHRSVDTLVAGPSGTIASSRSLTAADLVAPVVW